MVARATGRLRREPLQRTFHANPTAQAELRVQYSGPENTQVAVVTIGEATGCPRKILAIRGVPSQVLLANAEVAEDVIENIVRVNGPQNHPDVLEGGP